MWSCHALPSASARSVPARSVRMTRMGEAGPAVAAGSHALPTASARSVRMTRMGEAGPAVAGPNKTEQLFGLGVVNERAFVLTVQNTRSGGALGAAARRGRGGRSNRRRPLRPPRPEQPALEQPDSRQCHTPSGRCNHGRTLSTRPFPKRHSLPSSLASTPATPGSWWAVSSVVVNNCQKRCWRSPASYCSRPSSAGGCGDFSSVGAGRPNGRHLGWAPS